jgi:hypothetical protein
MTLATINPRDAMRFKRFLHSLPCISKSAGGAR